MKHHVSITQRFTIIGKTENTNYLCFTIMASETFIIDDFTVTPSHEAFIDELSCNDQMIDCEAFEAIEMIKSFEEKYTIEAIASYDQITKVFNVKWEGSDENTDEHLMEKMDEDRGLLVMITNFLLTKHYR